MKEYTDGIILYKAEQTEVWNKTSVTDSSLRKYFSENREKFVFPERVKIGEIEVESDTTALMLYDSLKHGSDFASLATRWNEDPDLRSKGGMMGFQIVDTNEVSKQAAALEPGEVSEPIELDNGGYVIVKLYAKEPARRKTFEEAGAEVSNDYQEHISKALEKHWVNTELLYQEARRQGVESSEPFVHQLEDVRRQLANQSYLERTIYSDTGVVTTAQMVEYFRQHASEFLVHENTLKLNVIALNSRDVEFQRVLVDQEFRGVLSEIF